MSDAAPTVVHVGPSLDARELRAALGVRARLLPPVRRGDLDALEPGVRRVAIIDGVFFGVSAVSPREILDALRRGIEVWGSSSMGALRAAELAPFGMRGVGEVYRRYAGGEIDSDAEVALVFDPDTGKALTQPHVAVRRMVELALEDRVLDDAQARAVLHVTRALPYPDLTYPAVLAATAPVLPAPVHAAWAAFVPAHVEAADLKRHDALLLAAELTAAGEPATTPEVARA
ncbi:MAG: TfuA-like protein [Kineosporiaceae bacterium]